MSHANVWAQILSKLEAELDTEALRKWFGPTAYASDSGDQITVWVPSESIRRHIALHYKPSIDRALIALGRPDTHVRLLVAGFDDDDDEVEEEN